MVGSCALEVDDGIGSANQEGLTRRYLDFEFDLELSFTSQGGASRLHGLVLVDNNGFQSMLHCFALFHQ